MDTMHGTAPYNGSTSLKGFTPNTSSRHVRRRMDALARAEKKKLAKALKKGLAPLVGTTMGEFDECVDVPVLTNGVDSSQGKGLLYVGEDSLGSIVAKRLFGHTEDLVMSADGKTCICNRHGDHDHK